MRATLAILAAIVFSCMAFAQDPNEVTRSAAEMSKTLKPTAKQSAAMKSLDSKYGALLVKLRKQAPKDYTIQRDALNEKYTKEEMALLSPVQKSSYRKYIRSLRQAFIKAHPETDADGIFIWGGANLL